MLKKILIFLLTLITLMSTVACGENESGVGGGVGGGGQGDIDNQTVAVDQTKLPEIKLTFPYGEPERKEEGYVSGYVTTANCVQDEILDAVEAEVKIRGNSTARADKKPYRIKFKKKQSMLGLNGGRKYRNWVLLADAYDYSMMRNYFIFNTGNLLSNIHSSDCKHVSLYINNIYQGVYLLAEQNEVNEGRIDVDELGVETTTNTGFFVEADSRALDECELFTPSMSVSEINTTKDYCIKVVYKSRSSKLKPDLEQLFAIKSDLSTNKEVAHAQLTRIQGYMQSVYDALFNYQGEEVIRSLIDVESAVDMFIVNNIASLRGGKRSDYYYIDFSDDDPKLHFGPPWDYDLDCGNYDMVDDPNSFQALGSSDYVNYTLNNNAWFVTEVKTRWITNKMYSKLKELLKTVDPYRSTSIPSVYKAEFDKNYEKWDVWGTKTIEFINDDVLDFTCHRDAVVDFYNWMQPHVEYANSQWGR